MKIYGISGLGADKRVFDYLDLEHPLIPIEWIEPKTGESLKDYSHRLSKAIDLDSEFALLGVSFGGLVAIEISKQLNPKMTIIISSIKKKNDLRCIYQIVGKLGLLKLLPKSLFSPPKFIAKYVFGANNKKLLYSILDDTDLNFAKWAVSRLLGWDNEDKIKNLLHIHGSKDKLIPLKNANKVEIIKEGEHFMVVDKAREISEKINHHLQNQIFKVK
ncbi:MAG: hypothetical protein Kapaf2KO_14930 [Candidatus Kapaibacteriales bacterium]